MAVLSGQLPPTFVHGFHDENTVKKIEKIALEADLTKQ